MIEIKTANIACLEELAFLFDAYRAFYGKESDIVNSAIFLQERIENNESIIYIAYEDSKMIGFVQLYPIFSSTKMKKLWLLNDLFVDINYRSKGVSVKLIDECKELCRKTNSCGLLLETAKNNEIGNNLYLKTSFSLDTEHNYYSWDNF